MIKIIAMGKIKEKYFADGISEYIKRISHFTKVEIVEINDLALPENPNQAEIDRVLKTEGDLIISKIGGRDYVIAMAIEGAQLSSEDLSQKIEAVNLEGHSNIDFIIGSSFGLSPEVKEKANQLVSFGLITLPHQLMRLVLAEQIYRAYMIRTGSAYHK